MSTPGAPTYDPRSIITPDAFEVSSALLGLPLATPWQRLWAILIDLAVIGMVTLLTKSFAMVLGVVAAFFFVRAGFKRTPVQGSAFDRAMRLSVGCLGLMIGLVTAIVWASFGIGGRSGSSDAGADRPSGEAINIEGRAPFLSVLQGVNEVSDFRSAPDAAAARAAAERVARRAAVLGIPDDDVRDLLLEAVPKDASWADDARLIMNEVLADDAPEPAPEDSVRAARVARYSTAEALETYADLLRKSDDTTAAAGAFKADLRARLVGDVAADTLRILEEHLSDMDAVAATRFERLQKLQSEVAEAEKGPSVFGWIKNAVNELGFGFGWASLYLTVTLSWWKGQTVGKRLMRIRVLCLDGEPITWWTAFERAGGYAAGFATGLLGFAQVFWDANRQAIHDRIVGTVVVKDGASRVVGWEEAL